MCSRQRQLSWQTAALVLAGLVAFAARRRRARPGEQALVEQGQHAAQSGKHAAVRKARQGNEVALGAGCSAPRRSSSTINPGQEANAEKEIRKLGGRVGRRLKLVDGMAVELPNRVIKQISERSEVLSVHFDRPICAAHQSHRGVGRRARGAAAVGLRRRRRRRRGHRLGHRQLARRPRLPGQRPKVRVVNGQRVTAFVDFVNDRLHGVRRQRARHARRRASSPATATTRTARTPGIAPAAHLVSLKVLDQHGGGVISDVIAAFEWAVANRVTHNIRVINLSVGARVTESYETDPLTLAAKRAVDAGIVVVTAAGNLGQKTTVSGRRRRSTAASRRPATRPGC